MNLILSKLASCSLAVATITAQLTAADPKLDEPQQNFGTADAHAQYLLGCAYMKGKETPQDYTKAAEVLRSAAMHGHAKAQTNLGYLYVNGLGVAKNPAEGVKWYRRAAEQGELQAQQNLAQLFDRGYGIAPDRPEALHWYRKAAEQGHLQSQYQLGLLLYLGDEKHLHTDYPEAAKWLEKARDKGMPEAWNALGVMHEDGLGFPVNPTLAFEYFEKAARHGEAKAQANVGRCHALGIGTGRDVVQAYKWLKLGDSNRELTATKVLVGVIRSMTPEQIAMGEKLVAEFKPLPMPRNE